ncbi:MAG: hypothetical protein AB1634_19320, partial [Thermodesulfobacteriota bacterium]
MTAGSKSHAWDSRGLETSTTLCRGICKTVGTEYDAIGRARFITYPDGERVENVYDANGNLQSVSGYATNLLWDARGQLTDADFANGTATSYGYDGTRRWLETAEVTDATGLRVYQATYHYDDAGRVTDLDSLTHPGLNQTLVYDDLNRLTSVEVNGLPSQDQSFGYDPLGNFTTNSREGSYTYDPAHPHAVKTAGGATYTYDANGNMLTGNGRTLTWDAVNRLSSVTMTGQTTRFWYDHQGRRVEKSGPAGTSKYFGRLVEVDDGQLVQYYYAGPMLIAKKQGGNKTWFHSDHLGSVRLMTNASGTVVKRYEYAAFGETIAETSGGPANERGFTGHVSDPETGLIYMGARYY